MAFDIDFSTYPGSIKIHVKGFFTALEKAQKDAKHYVTAEKKIAYIKGKDEEVASELESYLNNQREGSELKKVERPKADSKLKKESATANTGGGGKVPTMHLKLTSVD